MRLVTYITKSVNSSIFILSLLYGMFLYQFPENFKLSVVVTILFIGLLCILTKNLFISIFVCLLVSSQFFLPAKNYPFEYASSREYVYELFPNGIFESIAINISDICSLFLVLYFIRNKAVEFFTKTIRVEQSRFHSILESKPIVISLTSWLVYIILSLYSSINYSFNPAFSINLVAQYGKMIVIFLGVLYLFSSKSRFINLFYIILLSMLLFQIFMGLQQFSTNITTQWVDYKPIIDVEQKTNFFRIGGPVGDPNAYALVLVILFIITVPFVLKHKHEHWWIISLLGLICIILSQSRTVWLALVILSLFLYIRYPLIINNMIIRNITIKTAYVLIFGTMLCFAIILPRLQASIQFFSYDGGGQLRLTMLKEGWLLLQQAPLSGFGAGAVVRMMLNNFRNGYIVTFPFTVHFVPLHIALESGIPAMVAFFVPFYLILRKWFMPLTKNQSNNLITTSAICSIIIVLISYALQPTYGRQDYMYIGLIVGIGAATMYSSTKSR